MKKENIYIAGPMCFYTNGRELWSLMRKQTEWRGHGVTMPNDNETGWDPVDLQKNARGIFANCQAGMKDSTAILCNLEFFRSSNPDGGSMFELGMAYAHGIPCYGYTRDLRPAAWKYQNSTIRNGIAIDEDGRPFPYKDIPFSPNITGACRIVEGDYTDCLDIFEMDVREKRKRDGLLTGENCGSEYNPEGNAKVSEIAENTAEKMTGRAGETAERMAERARKTVEGENTARPLKVYLAGPERYDDDAAAKYEALRKICIGLGYEAIAPTDPVPGVPEAESEDPYTNAYRIFLRQQQHVRDCDIILANLNDFHGWEPDSDTAFECGMAFWLKKKSFGFMADTTKMIDRIPNYGETSGYRDICGCNAENFDYPINLMFSGSMPILTAEDFEEALSQMAEELR